ncbi:MAG: hypothetical protein AB7P02_19290 [Alphaproteobacteria bacterium]
MQDENHTPAEDIAWALRDAAVKVGPKKHPLPEGDRLILAAAILRHLQLCGWRITRAPPAAWHSWPPPGAKIPGTEP